MVSRSVSVAFDGVDGCALFGQGWLPQHDPRAVVIVAHGMSEHSGRYHHVGSTFAAAGLATWALDHRGHGRSGGRRAFVRSFDEYVADLEAFRLLVTQRHPDIPMVLLGHSMGGAIATAHAIDHPDRFDGLILTGPALQPSLGINAAVIRVGRIVARVRPTLGIMAPNGAKVSRDPAVVAAYRADPLVRRGKITAGLGAALLARAARFPDEVGSLRLPVLVIHGDADALVPVASSRNLVPRFGSGDLTYIEEPGLYHEVLNEPEQERIMTTMLQWMAQRLAAGSRPGSHQP
ncbi:MAG: lysophospholipase [Acidimicrobiales bacterium]